MSIAIFVVTDIEADGPFPEQNSMLSLASVAIDPGGRIQDVFSANLLPRVGAVCDEGTMIWWRENNEAWAKLQIARVEPGAAVQRWSEWVEQLPGTKIFAAHPLSFDGPWVDWHLNFYLGRRLFERPRKPGVCAGGGLDILSLLMGKMGWKYEDCFRENYPSSWLDHIAHDHSALSDALGYASLLAHLLTRDRLEMEALASS